MRVENQLQPTPEQAMAFFGGPEDGPFSADELTRQLGWQSTLLDDVCKAEPVAVFDIATDVLNRVAERASALADDMGRSLAMMEARRVASDRLQAENRKMLEALLAGGKT